MVMAQHLLLSKSKLESLFILSLSPTSQYDHNKHLQTTTPLYPASRLLSRQPLRLRRRRGRLDLQDVHRPHPGLALGLLRERLETRHEPPVLG